MNDDILLAHQKIRLEMMKSDMNRLRPTPLLLVAMITAVICTPIFVGLVIGALLK